MRPCGADTVLYKLRVSSLYPAPSLSSSPSLSPLEPTSSMTRQQKTAVYKGVSANSWLLPIGIRERDVDTQCPPHTHVKPSKRPTTRRSLPTRRPHSSLKGDSTQATVDAVKNEKQLHCNDGENDDDEADDGDDDGNGDGGSDESRDDHVRSSDAGLSQQQAAGSSIPISGEDQAKDQGGPVSREEFDWLWRRVSQRPPHTGNVFIVRSRTPVPGLDKDEVLQGTHLPSALLRQPGDTAGRDSASGRHSACTSANARAGVSGSVNERAGASGSVNERANVSGIVNARAGVSGSVNERTGVSSSVNERASVSGSVRAGVSGGVSERAGVSGSVSVRASGSARPHPRPFTAPGSRRGQASHKAAVIRAHRPFSHTGVRGLRDSGQRSGPHSALTLTSSHDLVVTSLHFPHTPAEGGEREGGGGKGALRPKTASTPHRKDRQQADGLDTVDGIKRDFMRRARSAPPLARRGDDTTTSTTQALSHPSRGPSLYWRARSAYHKRLLTYGPDEGPDPTEPTQNIRGSLWRPLLVGSDGGVMQHSAGCPYKCKGCFKACLVSPDYLQQARALKALKDQELARQARGSAPHGRPALVLPKYRVKVADPKNLVSIALARSQPLYRQVHGTNSGKADSEGDGGGGATKGGHSGTRDEGDGGETKGRNSGTRDGGQ